VKNHSPQLRNAHCVIDAVRSEEQFFEPLVHEPSAFVIEMATENLNEKQILGYWSDFIRISSFTCTR